MPNLWGDCVKIHEDCGGVCRWIEAVTRPAVGYTGQCIRCGEENIPVERMIPVESLDHEEAFTTDPSILSELAWDEGKDWETNQARIDTVLASGDSDV